MAHTLHSVWYKVHPVNIKMALPTSVMGLYGWCSMQKAQRLYNFIKEVKPQFVVEFGVYGGRSFLPMAIALKDLGQGRIVGVDTWRKEDSLENYNPEDPDVAVWHKTDYEVVLQSFVDALKTYGVDSIASYHRCKTREMLHTLDDESVDVLHQDANHSESSSCEEVTTFFNKIKHGGYWVMDDTDWKTTQRAQILLQERGFVLVEDYHQWRIFRRI